MDTVDITTYKLLLYNGDNGAVYAWSYLVAGSSAGSSGVFLTKVNFWGIQNGKDGFGQLGD